jgi:hypothetical protein
MFHSVSSFLFLKQSAKTSNCISWCLTTPTPYLCIPLIIHCNKQQVIVNLELYPLSILISLIHSTLYVVDSFWMSLEARSHDYECGFYVDEDFETVVYKLHSYFGFFKLARACETILRFYSYDVVTNYVKYRTWGLEGDPRVYDILLGYPSSLGTHLSEIPNLKTSHTQTTVITWVHFLNLLISSQYVIGLNIFFEFEEFCGVCIPSNNT